MVKKPPCNAGDTGSIPGQRTKIPHAMEQLSPGAATTEPSCHTLESPCNATEGPACHDCDPRHPDK